MDTILEKLDTFKKVKETLESQHLRKLRINNIYKAFQLQVVNNKTVKIVYDTDHENNKIIWAPVMEYDDYHVTISDSTHIPIRAIKEIQFR